MAIATPSVEWRSCSLSPGCNGVAIPNGDGGCLAHTGQAARERAFARVHADRRLDVRGVEFDADLWGALRDRVGAGPALAELRLDRACLPAAASLAGVTIDGELSADGARFGPDLDCSGAQIAGPAWFRQAAFEGAADFSGCAFAGGVEFRDAQFAGDAHFTRTVFARGVGELGGARFHNAIFRGAADFRDARFEARAGFRGVRFLSGASFGARGAAVKTSQPLGPAHFGGFTSFDGAAFAQGTSFVRVGFDQTPSFLDATFGSDEAAPEAEAPPWAEALGRGGVSFDRAAFPAGAGFDRARFRVRAAFTNAQFGGLASFGQTAFMDDARFSGASFDHTRFADARFSGEADFRGARFAGGAEFGGSCFAKPVTFDGSVHAAASEFGETEFKDDASFVLAEFHAGARFTAAHFAGSARFGAPTDESLAPSYEGARFGDAATFRGAIFAAEAAFMGVRFDGEAGFADARFSSARFVDARFTSRASFERASFSDFIDACGALFEDDVEFKEAKLLAADAHFERTRFKAAARFERMQFTTDSLKLDDASFAQRLILQVTAGHVWLVRAQFAGGLVLRADGGAITIEETEFGQPSTVSTAAGAAKPARVLSLRGSDVGKLALAGVDLAACRFDGAHNLAGLRIEGTEVFERTPAGYLGTRRQAIAEEHEWRRDHPRLLQSKGWYPAACAFPAGLDALPRKLEPHEISAIYRDLRKGREDNKDAPGAADFYYGEMEMRRYSGPRTPWAERAIVTGYWAVSGYGLRASRSLAALAVLVALFAVLFWQFGFAPGAADPSFTRALLFSLESTTSLLRGMDRALSTTGEAMWIVLRIAGPLLFGLAVLSLRGRVKR